LNITGHNTWSDVATLNTSCLRCVS